MFVTKPGLELWVPPGIAAPGENYWSAVLLGVDLPWFLLTVWQQDGKTRCSQTIAVAWESTLRQLIETADPGCIAAVNCVFRAPSGPARWQMHDVAEVWIPSQEEASDRGPLLFSLADRTGLFDSHCAPVNDDVLGRRLLVSFST
jgi:hypothetical protein